MWAIYALSSISKLFVQNQAVNEDPPPADFEFTAGDAMAAQSECRGETSEPSPPPYDEVSESIRADQREPGPATCGRWYLEDPEPETLEFTLSPDPSQYWFTQDWAARLSVKCGDIPRLMRDGFYWDSRNVVNEDGFIRQGWTVGSDIPRSDGRQWCGSRRYFLKDLQQPPRWTASIRVLALHETTLYHFDLGELTRERIQRGKACGRGQNIQSADVDLIYKYYYDRPQSCFNAIYDNMPMEGYWPWPRKKTEIKEEVEEVPVWSYFE
ncbi:hypothetical protein O1611_g2897 [Lasiodiplodia mahajangana]|uniref:Uncharacterized protein n=1 Tax=Lasiodiplodia mahajangana TaxID=1108764 RepID=A0ACC2JT95_9PEZI|nr:hypothetical protein O1611_g2897 [Lasiodiplodia mahajangana]